MDGTLELMNVAYMLRLGAGVAAEIAVLRPDHAAVIRQLAAQASSMATQIDQLLWLGNSKVSFC